MTPKIIAVDFDGTLVEHEFPAIGRKVKGAFETLKRLQAMGHRIILWTMRSGDPLQEAVDFCRREGLQFDGINVNPWQSTWTTSPKVYAHAYIDDAATGCPLIASASSVRPFVDWDSVATMLGAEGFFG